MPWQIFSQKFSGVKSLTSHAAIALATTAVLFSIFLSFHLLICEQIKVVLDEVVAEGKEVAFKHDIYADIYTDILGLMAKCDTSPIHRAKTKTLRVQWAKIGRFVVR